MHKISFFTTIVLLWIPVTQVQSATLASLSFPEDLQQYFEQQYEHNQPLIIAASKSAELLKQSITALVQMNLTCASAADCTGVAIGVAGCGGSTNFIAYSKGNKYAAIIKELGVDAQEQSRLLNQLSMMSSDCMMPPIPKFGCFDGICSKCTSSDQQCIAEYPLPTSSLLFNQLHLFPLFGNLLG